MLKCKIKNGRITRLVVKGTILDTLAEVSFLVAEMYRMLSKHDEEKGELFKRAFIAAVTDEDSPVWKK